MHRASLSWFSRLFFFALFFASGSAVAAPAPIDEFFAAIKAADLARVQSMLARDPALASARRPDGVSAVVAASSIRQGEGFVCMRRNPVLRAILSRAGALDVFEAAVTGDAARLDALTAKDRRLVASWHPRLGWTPLHFAAFGGSLEAVKLLLARGAAMEARAKNRFHNTPLQTALLCGERGVMAHLLGRGADPNVRQGEGFVPLHDAAFQGRIDLLELLLDHGAEINVRGRGGETPLGTALRKGNTETIRFLRGKGALE